MALASANAGAHSLLGWHHAPSQPAQVAAPSPAPQAKAAGNLAGVAKQATGSVSHVAPALEAAARGESVAEQAQRVTGPVKMTAADALTIAGAMAPDPGGSARQAISAANTNSPTGYRSPFVGIGLSGITNDQDAAENLSRVITGDPDAHGYAAYGTNRNSRLDAPADQEAAGRKVPAGTQDGNRTVTDVAAVTQYAAAAQLGIRITPRAVGEGRQVQIDWGALSNMHVQADLGGVKGKIDYDSPAQVARNGEQAVLADMAARGTKPEDKGQFISLTGHSGGGQSSFYTALKLASDGYKNVSVVGVDMAMTPHEREVLETLGVRVTNITSNSNIPVVGGTMTSPVGDGIRTGMGGGQNYYDLNVHRQNDTVSPGGLHGMTNDANVATTVRFAQYLDSIGQHGQYSPEQYARFLADTHGTGNQVSTGKDANGNPLPPTTADADLFGPNSTKVTDQRGRPGPEANSTQLGGGASLIESVVNLLGGKPVTQAIQGVGQTIHNGFDAAGGLARSAFGLLPQAGSFLGGLVHQGADLLGSGVSTAGNLLGSGLNAAGNLAQSTMSGVAGVSNFLGSAASSGLHAVGSGVSSVGTAIGNGLGHAGDTAKSWLGHIPLLGGFLGNVADKGLHLLGSGASAVGNLLGNGVDAVGDAAQWATGKVAGGASALGGLAHDGLAAAGSGARTLGGAIGSGLDTAGGWAQSALTGASSAAGNFLGNAASGTLGAIGNGFGSAFNWLGDKAGGLVRMGTAPLVHKLQGYGLDTSQIAGLSDFQSTNYSEGWKRQMAQDQASGAPRNVQTIDVPDRGPQPGNPVHSLYAN